MLVSFLSGSLSQKISFLNHGVSTRNQLPVLSNFLVEAKDGRLIISATDLEIGIISSISASVEEEGRITVPAKSFSDLLSNMADQKTTLSLEENTLKLKGEKVEASFQTTQADEFPKIYDQKGVQILSTDKKEIEEFFTRVSFAAAVDSARPALSGVLVEKDKDSVSMIATDSYRLSYQKTPLKTSDELDKSIVIPSRIIKEVLYLKEEDTKISIYISKESNQILFFQGDTILVGRLIDDQYPAYGKIIPTEFNTKAEIGREELLNAIRICSVFARETANIVKMSLGKNKLVVSANSPSVGKDQAEIDAVVTGEENEIAFNAKYLIDALSALSEDRLIFEMNGPLSPGVFKVKGDSNFLHLIMPIRVEA